jgi:hypothetical protein
MLLGPKCNHDVGVMAKFPVLTPEQTEAVVRNAAKADAVHGDITMASNIPDDAPSAMSACEPPGLDQCGGTTGLDMMDDSPVTKAPCEPEGDMEESLRGAVAQCIANSIQDMVDCEYYTSDYTTKDQPHANNLLQTLYDSNSRYLQYKGEREAAGKSDAGLEGAQRLLQSLASATSRRVCTSVCPPCMHTFWENRTITALTSSKGGRFMSNSEHFTRAYAPVDWAGGAAERLRVTRRHVTRQSGHSNLHGV